MAHWKQAVVTDGGTELLNEWMAGRKLTVTSVYGGTGTVDEDVLYEQTGLVEQKQKLALMGKESGPEGVSVQVQVNNRGLAAEYELNQVAVYAALDRDKDPDSPESLLFLMQDEKGVTVPEQEDEIFLLELFCAIGITNNGRFIVTVDMTGLVSVGRMNETIAAAIQAHNEDPDAHGGGTGGAQATIVDITIPTEGWTETALAEGDDEDEAELQYPFYYDITAAVTAADRADVCIETGSLYNAAMCGFCPVVETLAGTIRVRAQQQPEGPIRVQCWITEGVTQ